MPKLVKKKGNGFVQIVDFCCLVQVGNMIQAESDAQKRDEYLQRLMQLPNQVFYSVYIFQNINENLKPLISIILVCLFLCTIHISTPVCMHLYSYSQICQMFLFMNNVFVQKWAEIIGQARVSVDYLKDQDVIRVVLNILQVLTFHLFKSC